MRKTIKALLIVGSLGALCAGLAACSKKDTVLDEYNKQGYIIVVNYDGSGGKISGGSNVSIVDMFNPEKFEADENGYIHIKLREPTTRQSTADNITVERTDYELVGWYQDRQLVKNEKGEVVDEEGTALVEKNEKYYRVTIDSQGATVEEEAIPAYTFSKPWNFEKDRVDFKVGESGLDMTLYAAWIPKYSFEYYYEVEDEETHQKEWTKFGTTTFNYIEAQSIDRDDSTKITDSVFVPDWSEGKMEHKYSGKYTFPSVADMTFKAAYLDKECTEQITRSNPYRHPGSLNYDTAAPVNPVQKIYVEFDKGNYYRISSASEFAGIGDAAGYYTIINDTLDFNCSLKDDKVSFTSESILWPTSLMISTFTGKILSESGNALTFKNVGAQYNNRNTIGGLFGEIGKGAVIDEIVFENVIFDVKSATSTGGLSFGTFAGNIKDGATLESVTIGGQLRFWDVSVYGTRKINLVANCEKEEMQSRITNAGIVLTVCGERQSDTEYYFSTIDPEKTSVDAQGNVTLAAAADDIDERYKNQQFYIINGGDNNE